jgi:hypothetical protein
MCDELHISCRVSNHAPSLFKFYYVPRFEPYIFQIEVLFCVEFRTTHLPNSSRIMCRDSNQTSSKLKSYFLSSFEPCTFPIQVLLCVEIRTIHLPDWSLISFRVSNHAPSKSKSYFVTRLEPRTSHIQARNIALARFLSIISVFSLFLPTEIKFDYSSGILPHRMYPYQSRNFSSAGSLFYIASLLQEKLLGWVFTYVDSLSFSQEGLWENLSVFFHQRRSHQVRC